MCGSGRPIFTIKWPFPPSQGAILSNASQIMIQSGFQISTLVETACDSLVPCCLNQVISTQIKVYLSLSEDYKAK